MKRKTKFGIGGAAVVLVIIVASSVMGSSDRGMTAVRIEPATTRDLVATVTASGWIRPRMAIDVQADIMGRVIELPVKEGDRVRRGQLLLRIDPSQYEAALSQTRAGVSTAQAQEAQARASLIQADRALERARAMAANASLVSKQMLEEAETQARVQAAVHEAARYGVERARAALAEAQDRLQKTVIRAPIDGVVTRLNIEAGEMAIVGTMNNPGSLLLTISDLSVMEAVVRVDETDVPELQLGDSAAVEIDAFPGRTFAGKVTQVGHSATALRGGSTSAMGGGGSQAVDFEVVITLDDPPATLRPDLSANADIITDTRTGVLTVPIIALTVREIPEVEEVKNETRAAREAARAAAEKKAGEEEGVYVVKDGKAKFMPVKIGVAGQEHFEVISGISAGDSVVAGPYEAVRDLEDGKPVRPMRTEGDKAGAESKS